MLLILNRTMTSVVSANLCFSRCVCVCPNYTVSSGVFCIETLLGSAAVHRKQEGVLYLGEAVETTVGSAESWTTGGSYHMHIHKLPRLFWHAAHNRQQ